MLRELMPSFLQFIENARFPQRFQSSPPRAPNTLQGGIGMGQVWPDTASSKMSAATDARIEKDQRYRDRQREEIVAPLPGLHALPPVNTKAMALALC
jgi:hypothetical protein